MTKNNNITKQGLSEERLQTLGCGLGFSLGITAGILMDLLEDLVVNNIST